MTELVRNIVIGVAFVPLVVAGAVFVRHVRAAWSPRNGRSDGRRPIGRAAAVFGLALAMNVWLLMTVMTPPYRRLTASDYVAAVTQEAGRGNLPRAMDLAWAGLKDYPGSGDLSALQLSMLLRTGDCDGVRRLLVTSPAVVSAEAINHRHLITLARAIRVCGLALKENPAAVSLIDVLRTRLDKREEHDLLKVEMGLLSGMGTDFRAYARALPAGASFRDETPIEGVTTHAADKGRQEFVVYFRPSADWQGRRLWVHAYPPGSREYLDVAGDFPAFGGWRKGELAWEVFQTPDERPFNIYLGVAIGDDLGPAVPIGVIGAV